MIEGFLRKQREVRQKIKEALSFRQVGIRPPVRFREKPDPLQIWVSEVKKVVLLLGRRCKVSAP